MCGIRCGQDKLRSQRRGSEKKACSPLFWGLIWRHQEATDQQRPLARRSQSPNPQTPARLPAVVCCFVRATLLAGELHRQFEFPSSFSIFYVWGLRCFDQRFCGPSFWELLLACSYSRPGLISVIVRFGAESLKFLAH